MASIAEVLRKHLEPLCPEHLHKPDWEAFGRDFAVALYATPPPGPPTAAEPEVRATVPGAPEGP